MQRIIRDVEWQGKTVKQILEESFIREVLGNPEDLTIFCNDARIPSEEWKTFVPPGGTVLIIKVVPRITLLAGFIATSVFGAASLATASFGIAFASYAIATVVVVGALAGLNILLGKLFGPKQQSLDGSGQGSPALLLGGSRNDARPFEPVPRIYGSWQYTPPFAGNPFTTTKGKFQILQELFTFGYGPLQLSNFRIGDAPFSDFLDAELEIREVTATDNRFNLYPTLVADQNPGVLFRDEFGGTPWSVRTTSENATRIQVDLLAPNGLMRINEHGKKRDHSYRVEVQYRPTGTGEHAWIALRNDTISKKDPNAFFLNYTWDVAKGQYDVQIRLQSVHAQNNYTKDRNGTGQDASSLLTDLQWVSLKSFEEGEALEHPGTVGVAIRLQASEQLNGIVDEFNALAESKLPLITAGGTLTEQQVTRNPAPMALNILMGSANGNPIPLSQIDLPAFYDWQEFCTANDLNCDVVFDFSTSVFDAFNTVARVGRAALIFKDDKWSVMVDDGNTTPVQLFTPRNSSNFGINKIFSPPVHAVRARLPDRTNNFRAQEIVVFNDGYSAKGEVPGTVAATEYESVDQILGITEGEQMHEHIRYEMLSARFRPEVFTLDCGLDVIVCNRGDVVRVRHDVPLFGLGQGYVASVTTGGGGSVTGVTIDDNVTFEFGKTYAVEVRKNQDTSFITSGVTNPSTGTEVLTNVLTFTTPLASGSVNQGDLLAYGLSNAVAANLRVVGIEMKDDLTATVTMVAAAPEIQTALASGTAPPFNPGITIPAGFGTLPPAKPEILSTQATIKGYSGDGEPIIRVRNFIVPGTTTSGSGLAPTTGFFSQWRIHSPIGSGTVSQTEQAFGLEHPWITLPEVSVQSGEIDFEFEGTDAYDFRVWALSPKRIKSVTAAAIVAGTIIDSEINAPTNLRIETVYGSDAFGSQPAMRIRWDDPQTRSAIRYIVRYRFQSNQTLVQETFENQFDVVEARRGLYTISVQAIDLGGNLSEELEGTFAFSPDVPLDPLRVTGLELTGQHDGTEFGGKDIKLQWRINSSVHGDGLEGTNFGEVADSGAQDPFFLEYVIEVLHPETNEIVRTVRTLNPFFTYTFEMNAEDFPSETVNEFWGGNPLLTCLAFNDLGPDVNEALGTSSPQLLNLHNMWSISLWVKKTALAAGSNVRVLSIRTDFTNVNHIEILSLAERLRLLINSSVGVDLKDFDWIGAPDGAGAFGLDTWKHFVITWNGTLGVGFDVNVYMNGVSITGSANKGTDVAGTQTNSARHIGICGLAGSLTSNNAPFRVLNVGMWSTVLNQEEIFAIFHAQETADLTINSGAYSSRSTLVHYYPFHLNSPGSFGNDHGILPVNLPTESNLDASNVLPDVPI